MAKKYNVTFANGTEQTVTSKKAVKALEGIVKVTAEGQDITNEFVKEDEVMAENKNIEAIETEAIEETEVVEVLADVPEVPETTAEAEEVEAVEDGPHATLLFTASRGNAKRFAWHQITVGPEDETVKVRGCAAMLPIQVAEVIGTDKFVSWFNQAEAEKCVAEEKQVRGMASTFSDIFARYIKVNDIKGAKKLETVLNIFRTVLAEIEAGKTEGEWVRPEPEVEAPKPEAVTETAAEETAETEAEEISTEIEDIEVA